MSPPPLRIFALLSLLVVLQAPAACTTECLCDCTSSAPDAGGTPPTEDVFWGTDASGPCRLYCPDGVTCILDLGGQPVAHLCEDGVYEMASLVESCGFAPALEMALVDDCADRLTPGGARVLWFPANGVYEIEEPLFVVGTGLEFRGDGASSVGLDPPDSSSQGTVFHCRVNPGETCLTLQPNPELDARTGMRVEGITFTWSGPKDTPEGGDTVGLRLEGLSDAIISDVTWDAFPGTAFVARDLSYSSLHDLVFYAGDAAASTALRLECDDPEEPGLPIRCSNGNSLERLRSNGYEVAVHLLGGNGTTLSDSSFIDSREHDLLVDGVESLLVEGCRFEDTESTDSVMGAHVDIVRQEGWWFPDVTVDTAYFSCRCAAARYPIRAEAPGTGTVPRPRVVLRSSTFRNCALGPLLRDDALTLWQCDDNRVVQKVSSSPSVYETYVLDACATDDEMPAHPETCAD